MFTFKKVPTLYPTSVQVFVFNVETGPLGATDITQGRSLSPQLGTYLHKSILPILLSLNSSDSIMLSEFYLKDINW